MPRRGSAGEERLNENLVEIGGRVRIERGPKRKTAKASAKLLDNSVTADHYKVGAPDALGKVIREDQPMTYLDWLGESCWYVYALRTEQVQDPLGNPMVNEDGSPVTQERWVEVDVVDGEEDAALERARAALDSEE